MHTHDGNFPRNDVAEGQAPVAFVAHGAPLLAVEPGRAASLVRWAPALGRPSAILVISAHWETEGVMLGSTRAHERVVYDFGRALHSALFSLNYPEGDAVRWPVTGFENGDTSRRCAQFGEWSQG